MPEPRITQYGMRLFVTALADILVEFQQTPLDDRDSHWLIRHLKDRLEADTLRHNLGDAHRRSIFELFGRLEWLCVTQDLHVEYGTDELPW